jgi:16S rRNA (cytidine1402-2'-O)-methyltransferase
MTGTLFMVATPLGNLQDLSPHVRTCLSEVAVVYAEDTRRSGTLLSGMGLRRPLRSLHAHNEMGRVAEVVQRLQEGEDVAYLSDAGTPAISDPGAALVAAVHAAGFAVSPVAGPSALSAALSVAGFGGGARTPLPILFLGFLPTVAGARRAAVAQVQAHAGICVLFESARRLPALVTALAATQPRREICLCRELTKLYEQVLRRPLNELLAALGDVSLRGECTLVLGPVQDAPAPAPAADQALDAAIRQCLQAGIHSRDTATCLAAAFGRPRRAVYARVLCLAPDVDSTA